MEERGGVGGCWEGEGWSNPSACASYNQVLREEKRNRMGKEERDERGDGGREGGERRQRY